MKYLRKIIPTAKISLDDVIISYLQEGLIKKTQPFGVNEISKRNLELAGFNGEGYEDFQLFEKYFRLLNSPIYLKLKFYFSDGHYHSNGIDLIGCAAVKLLNIFKNHSSEIKSIYLLYEDYGDYGSLIVNDMLDIRFGKSGKYSRKGKYKILGLSTDFECNENWKEKSFNTQSAEKLKPRIDFKRAKGKYKNNKAMQQLINQLLEYFPEACST